MDEIKIIKKPISRFELKTIAKESFGDLVKAAVDIKKEIVAIGGEFHIDEEMLLIEQEKSNQDDIWGINLYPEKQGPDFIEFDSMINLKPGLGNRTRGIEDRAIREKITGIINKSIQQ